MNTNLLIFRGPADKAHASLGQLLNKYRNAFFREREHGVYEVTATSPVMEELQQLPDWSMQPGLSTA